MSRTDPYKKKPRTTKKTLLIFGEGLGEVAFLKHLKKRYAFNTGVSVDVKNGKGGTAYGIVVDTSNFPGSYDKRVAFLDNDKPDEEMTRARSEGIQRKVELVENLPCLEALLLIILNPTQDYSKKSSDWCKHEFQSKYIAKKRREEPSEYDRFFSKTLLDNCRSSVPQLDRIIDLIEGDF